MFSPAAADMRDPILWAGRPTNSPGWGMLTAVKSGTFRSPDGSEVVHVKAGVTRIAPSHWLFRVRPEWFRVADTRDRRTVLDHTRALERARRDLEGGRSSTGSASRSPAGSMALRPGVLPPRPADAPFRLPR